MNTSISIEEEHPGKKILPIWSSLGCKCFGRTPLWLLPSDLTPTDLFSDGDNDDDDDIMTNPDNYDEG